MKSISLLKGAWAIGEQRHIRGAVWRHRYAYGVGRVVDEVQEDHWAPDLADRADAWACTREDEELQAVYEEQLADYQRQMEYAYYMEKARRRAQEADLERQTAPWGQRWY